MKDKRVVVVVGAVVLAVVGGIFVLVLRDGRPLKTGVVPVLLVHGYGGTTESMGELTARIQASGRAATAVALPDGGRGDIEESATVLAEAVEETGAAEVDLVGFSAGGVVVRTYLAQLAGDERARNVVLVAAPNHGAEVASAAAAFSPALCTGACSQLRPGSSLLEELNESDESPGDAVYFTVWSASDRTVTPPNSAVLEGATNVKVQDVCPSSLLDHGELVRDPIPVGIVVDALDGRMGQLHGPRACSRFGRLGAAG